MLSCIKYRNRLGAYLDCELNLKECEAIATHLAKCAVCQKRLEDIRNLEGALNDTCTCPPVPDGFAIRIMREAQRRIGTKSAQTRPSQPTIWNPQQWLSGLSATMRIATCGVTLLACIIGQTMDNGLGDRQGQAIETRNNLYGLEWFAPTPPDSIGSIYIAMLSQTNEE